MTGRNGSPMLRRPPGDSLGSVGNEGIPKDANLSHDPVEEVDRRLLAARKPNEYGVAITDGARQLPESCAADRIERHVRAFAACLILRGFPKLP